MDCVSDPYVSEIVCVFPTQVGKTEFVLNVIGYHIAEDPCPILLVEPDLTLAEAISKDRIAPMLRDTPALKGKVKDPTSRNSGNTLLHKSFPGGHLTISGANSPASLASRPIRKLLLDERDRYPLSAGTEGDPTSLAEKRTSTFTHNRQIIRVSSPSKTVGSSIMEDYERSDKRIREVPCPHCGVFQVMKLAYFKFERQDGRAISVHLECISCKKAIEETEKYQMLAAARWRATAPFHGVAGFWLNEFYSPWTPWLKLVQDFLDKKEKPEELKVYVNTSLSELFEDRGEAPEWKKIYDRREKYRIGTVPYGGLFLTAGVDVQKDRIEMEVVAWGRGKESWSVDYMIFPGDTSTEDSEPFRRLAEALNMEYEHESGIFLPIRMMAVDSGYQTQTVYSWVRKWPRSRVIATKGKDSQPMIISHPKAVDFKRSGKTVRRGLKSWPVGVSTAKTTLYGWLNLETPAAGERKSGFCHFPEYSEEYFKQLTAESSKIKMFKGSPRWVWIKVHERNEALDCRVYALAAAYAYGMGRWQDQHWDDLANSVPAAPVKQVEREVKEEEPKAAEEEQAEIPRIKTSYL